MAETTFSASNLLAQAREGLAALAAQRAQMREALARVRSQQEEDERQARALAARIELGRAEAEQLTRNLLQIEGVIAYIGGQQSSWQEAIAAGESTEVETAK